MGEGAYRRWGSWREEETGEQRGTLEGGWGILNDVGLSLEGRRGLKGRRELWRAERIPEHRGETLEAEGLVQRADGGSWKDEGSPEDCAPEGGGNWKAERREASGRGSLEGRRWNQARRAEVIPKGRELGL